MANMEMIYQISSNLFTSQSFQYVFDVRDECNNLLGTVKQSPSPLFGYSTFDMGQIMRQYLGYDECWFTGASSIQFGQRNGAFTKQTITAGNFKFMFGEEYRPNTTASVTLYNGLNSASNASFSLPWTPPATEGRPLLSKNNQVVEDYVHEFVINGISEDESTETRLDPWWKNKKYISNRESPWDIMDTWPGSPNVCLTDAPRDEQYIDINDYHTISAINGNFEGSDVYSQDIYGLGLRIYNNGGTQLAEHRAFNFSTNSFDATIGAGPRSHPTQSWNEVNQLLMCSELDPTVQDIQTTYTQLVHMGVGPRNIIETFGFNMNSAYPTWDHYTVYVVPPVTSSNNAVHLIESPTDALWRGVDTGSIWWDEFTFYKKEDCIDKTRFAWINRYGVFDYFNCFSLIKNTETVARENWKQSHVAYSDFNQTGTDKRRRPGTRTLQNKMEETITTTTNWITQTQADWLEELFRSATVFIQVEDTNVANLYKQYIPVEIVNASVTKRTNPRSQKNFLYEITYRLANQKRTR
jgi:hypothetical protein